MLFVHATFALTWYFWDTLASVLWYQHSIFYLFVYLLIWGFHCTIRHFYFWLPLRDSLRICLAELSYRQHWCWYHHLVMCHTAPPEALPHALRSQPTESCQWPWTQTSSVLPAHDWMTPGLKQINITTTTFEIKCETIFFTGNSERKSYLPVYIWWLEKAIYEIFHVTQVLCSCWWLRKSRDPHSTPV